MEQKEVFGDKIKPETLSNIGKSDFEGLTLR